DGRDHALTALTGLHEPPRDVSDLVGVCDRRAAELHDDGLRHGLRARAHGTIVAATLPPCRGRACSSGSTARTLRSASTAGATSCRRSPGSGSEGRTAD